MIKKFLLFITITSQTVYGQYETSLNNEAITFISTLFGKKNYKVDLLDFEYSKEVKDILTRLQNFLATQKEWTQDYYSKFYKPGEGLPYHKNFGITEDDYMKIKNINKSLPTLIIKDTSLIEIERTSDLITFNSEKANTKFLESIKIDLKNSIIIFLTDTIPFSNQIKPNSLSAYGDVEGYSWKAEFSNIGNTDPLKNRNFSLQNYRNEYWKNFYD
jgi:hypothetical protein